MPTYTPPPLSTFSPERYFTAALNELFFGSGQYTIGMSTAERARKLAVLWNRHLVEHPMCCAITVQLQGVNVIISLSKEADEAITRAGYIRHMLQYITSKEGQEKVLSNIRAVLRNDNLEL